MSFRPASFPPAAALLACALVLTACSSAPSTVPSDDSPTSGAPTDSSSWSDWVELDFAASPVATRGDRVALHDHDAQTLSVHDATGAEVFPLPNVRMTGTYEPAIRSDDENLYIQLDEPGLPIVAVSWEDGAEVWRYELDGADECAPPETFEMRLGNEAGGGRANGVLMLTADYTGDESVYPEQCFAHSNAEMPSVPVAIGIDTITGQDAWDPVVDAIGTAMGAANGITGRYVYQLIRTPYMPTLNRIEVDSGAVDAIEFDGLLAAYDPLSYGDTVHMSDMGGDMFYFESASGEPEFLTVDSWTSGTQLIADPLPHDLPCEAYVRRSTIGFAYCVQSPDMSHDGQYWVGALASPEGEDLTGGSAASGERRDLWSAPGPAGLDGDWGYELDGYLGSDPISPGPDGEGVIALPGADAGLTAYGLVNGDELWAYGDEEPVSSTAYVPAVDEYLMLAADRLIAVDAGTGEESWAEQTAEEALFAEAGAITLTSNSSGTTRLRVATG